MFEAYRGHGSNIGSNGQPEPRPVVAVLPPTALGVPDAPSPGRMQAGNVRPSNIFAWRVVAIGLRPAALVGYDPANRVAAGVRREGSEVLAGLCTINPDLGVLTGLDLGAAQLAAEAAAATGVPYVAVLAYPDLERVWAAQHKSGIGSFSLARH